MTAPRSVLAAVAAAVVLAAGARAGVPLRDPSSGIPLRWDLEIEQPNVVAGEVTWWPAPGGSIEEPPGDETEETAIGKAFAAWQAVPGTGLRFREDPTRTALRPSATDRVNGFFWRRGVLGPYTVALTIPTARNGVLADADVVFNDDGYTFLWATTGTGLPGHADVQAVATHEIGHLLGLDHTPVSAATMSAIQPVGSIFGRSLEPDDEAAVRQAYPGALLPLAGSIHGTVLLRGRPVRRAVAVFAVAAATGEVVQGVFTEPDGQYSLRTLPAGPYRVVAAPVADPGIYSAWWSGAMRNVKPAFLDADGDGAPDLVDVPAGFATTRHDVAVRRAPRRGTGEPDDGPGEARPIAVGEAAVGAFEEPLDEDWFRLTAETTLAVDVRVRGRQMGSEGDADLAILDAAGTTVLASDIDIRAPLFEEWSFGPLGFDRDCEVVRFVPPAPGEYLLRVRSEPQGNSGSPGAFYVLTVLPSAGVP